MRFTLSRVQILISILLSTGDTKWTDPCAKLHHFNCLRTATPSFPLQQHLRWYSLRCICRIFFLCSTASITWWTYDLIPDYWRYSAPDFYTTFQYLNTGAAMLIFTTLWLYLFSDLLVENAWMIFQRYTLVRLCPALSSNNWARLAPPPECCYPLGSRNRYCLASCHFPLTDFQEVGKVYLRSQFQTRVTICESR